MLLINSYIYSSTVYGYLLDDYSGASAAYSVRLLRSSYSGALVRIRRSSDSAEKDFYPDGSDELSMSSEDGSATSLSSWISTDSGYVVTWYDQSGNGYDLTQSTAANQPLIVNAGSLVTVNGKAAMYTSTITTRLINASISLSQPVTHFGVIDHDDAVQSVAYDSYNNVQHLTVAQSSTDYTTAGTNLNYNGLQLPSVQTLFFNLFNSTSSANGFDGGNTATGNAGTNGLSGLSLMHIRGNPTPISASFNYEGYYQEHVIYNSDKTSDRSGIDSNINNFFSIY